MQIRHKGPKAPVSVPRTYLRNDLPLPPGEPRAVDLSGH